MKKIKWVSVLCSILFVITFSLHADLAWWDPEPSTPPTAGSMLADQPGGDTLLDLAGLNADYSTGNSPSDRVIYLLCNAGLLDWITLAYPNPQTNPNNMLRVYVDSLAADYDVICFSLAADALSPQQLRAQLALAYSGGVPGYGNLDGVMFVGDLPTAWFEYDLDYANDPNPAHIQRTVFPTDLYFMDLDGDWHDAYNVYDHDWQASPAPPLAPNGLFEDHSDPLDPLYIDKTTLDAEIWVGRLPVNTLAAGAGDTFLENQAALLDAYLTKNVNYRNQALSSDYAALSYIDQSEFNNDYSIDEAGTALKEIYGEYNVTAFGGTIANSVLTDKQHYLDQLGNSYEWVHIGVTSSAFAHTFGDVPFDHDSDDDGQTTIADYVTSAEIATNGSSALFYNFVGAGIARYTENDFIGGAYLFSDRATGLTLLGSTQSGGMRLIYNFYENIGASTPYTIGEALTGWVNSVLTDPGANPIRTAYGMTIIGDPTLIKSPDPVDTAIARGLDWLRNSQHQANAGNPDYGSWSSAMALTSFATLALLNAGDIYTSADNPQNHVDRGIRYLLQHITGINPAAYITGADNRPEIEYYTEAGDGGASHEIAWVEDTHYKTSVTYSTAATILALAATNDHSLDQVVERLGTFLIHSQWDRDSIVGTLDNGNAFINGVKSFGGFGYGYYGSRADNSNTQFAIMGIKVAREFLASNGVDLTLPFYFHRNTLIWYENTNSENGFGYGYADKSPRQSMTAAVLWCLALFADEFPALSLAYTNATSYLTNNYAINFSTAVAFYYTYTLAKAVLMSNRTELFDSGVHWYKYISEQLLNTQHYDGSWNYISWLDTTQRNYELNTAFALLSLELDRLPDNVYQAIILNSYCDLHIYDTKGRHTGANYTTGIIENLIPGTEYKIYRKGTNIEVPYDGGYVDDYDFEITQVILVKNAIATNYRIELKGVVPTAEPPQGEEPERRYHLTLEGGINGVPVTSKTVTGLIEPGEILAANQTVAPINGPVTIMTEAFKPSPMLSVEANRSLELLAKPGETTPFTFQVKEAGEKVNLNDVNAFCSDLIGSENNIPGTNMQFTFPQSNLTPGQEITVTGQLTVPADFLGIATGTIFVESANGGSKTITVTIFTNTRPVADAGPDQEHFAGSTGVTDTIVQLDGTQSSDEDGDPLTYTWYLQGTVIATGATPQVTLPPGNHTLSLSVNDGTDNSVEDNVTINLIAPVEGKIRLTRKNIISRFHASKFRIDILISKDFNKHDVEKNFLMQFYTNQGMEEAILPTKLISGRYTCHKYLKVTGYFLTKDILELAGDEGTLEFKVVAQMKDGRYIIGSDSVEIVFPRTYYKKCTPRFMAKLIWMRKKIKERFMPH